MNNSIVVIFNYWHFIQIIKYKFQILKVLSFTIIIVGIRADTETCNPLVFPAATDQGGGKKASTVLLLRRVDGTARWHLMRRSEQ